MSTPGATDTWHGDARFSDPDLPAPCVIARLRDAATDLRHHMQVEHLETNHAS
ncbi:MAG TPA: hypothetical protein VFH59_17430 [Frateuria sp.]|uniref:hypothetical protein n=1 Tax=Frateuria sp. TaxID=2211372 RepID=UPI002D80DA4A|nr:hypothetical protein [Frateuria sp.]HET6807221.1 hypothetical protein [Frateuria sp.]